MFDEIYSLANLIDTSIFFSGIIATIVMGMRCKQKGAERYKFIIKFATAFLVVMAFLNTFMNVYRYEKLAEQNNDPDYALYSVLAGIICLLIFATIIGILWLIYFIWDKIEKKRKL